MLTALLLLSATVAEGRPDLVVFLSDDHTCVDSSVYGSTEFPTPNMRRLADAGLTFEQAFVASPSCAPSRAALLTGLYPQNNGAEPNHSKPRADLKKLPAFLQELGYEVVSFGKVGHYRQTPDYGFDIARHYNYHEDIAPAEAAKWLRERASEKPLCLFVGTNWPHVPWPEPSDKVDPSRLTVPTKHVDTEATRTWRARYAEAVARTDRDLGLIYDTAREVLGDDVFFLHTSDHGAQWPFGKWTLYEDGIRTPLIVSWPGRIAAGERTDAMVSWIDILPTLVDVAGGDEPAGLDGRSFLPVLRGEADSHQDVLFTTHSGDGDYNVYPIRSARTADGWKYIRNLRPHLRFESHATAQRSDSAYWDAWVEKATHDPAARAIVRAYNRRPAEELFDLSSDPHELTNLAGDPAHRERLDTLRGTLDGWMARVDDADEIYGRPQRIADDDSPNVVVVFIDDMGFADLSCFGGQTETEHIDRLAAEGIRFANFYVNSPICSPSRTAITTGQWPQRWRIGSYLASRQANKDRGIAQWLDPDAPTLAETLREAGYFTGHFGKWHMGGQRDVGDAPSINRYGFDRSLTNFEGLGPRVLGLKDAYDGREPTLHALGSDTVEIGKRNSRIPQTITRVDRSLVTQTFVEAAIDHIDGAVAKGQPFYVNVWPDDVHSPFFPPQARREAAGESKAELYRAVLDAMDEQLAPLFDRIRSDDALRDQTLIALCSDNGHEPGAGTGGELRGFKATLYEGGIRSPLIIWGPGYVAADAVGTVNESSLLSAIDLNRSLYTLTGTEPSAPLDGEDLLHTFLGRSDVGRSAPLFFRRPPDRDAPYPKSADPIADAPDLAVRDGKWKLLVEFDGSDAALYDIAADPGETTDLSASHPDVTERLKTRALEWNRTMPGDAATPAVDRPRRPNAR